MPGKGSGAKGGGAASSVQNKLKKLGLLSSPGKTKQLTFEIFFPRPPYRGAQYRAARGKDGLYNFVGLVLGHGGATVQRVQKASGAKIEVRDSAGNLNGAHPSSHGDPSLHAWVAAASRQRLDKAVALLLEVLQPTNTELRPVTVAPGGSAVLEPVIPADWPEAATGREGAAAPAADAPAADAAKPPPPPPPVNAWASNRLLKQLPRQMSPVSSLQRSQGPTGSSNASSEVDEVEALQQAAARPAARPAAAGAAAAGAQTRLPPPPPPPPRSMPQSPEQLGPGPQDAAEQPAVPLTPQQAQLPRPPSHGPSPEQAQAPAAAAQQQPPAPAEQEQQPQGLPGQQQMAVVFAKGLHSAESGSASLPVTPPASPQRSPVAAQLSFNTADSRLSAAPSGLSAAPSAMSLGATASSAMSLDAAGSAAMSLAPQRSGVSGSSLGPAPSSTGSWSLWDQGGSGSSFYEQLQAAASDTFSIATASSGHSVAAAHAAAGHSRQHLPMPPAAAPAHLSPQLSPQLGSPQHVGTHAVPHLGSPHHVRHAHALPHLGSPRQLHQVHSFGHSLSPLGSPPHAQQHAYLMRSQSARQAPAHPLSPQLAAQQLHGHPLSPPQLQAHPLASLSPAHPLSPRHMAQHATHVSGAAPLLAPFPGLAHQGLGAGLGSPAFGSPGLGSPSQAAAAAALLQSQLQLAHAQQMDIEQDMQHLLAAVASMATLDG